MREEFKFYKPEHFVLEMVLIIYQTLVLAFKVGTDKDMMIKTLLSLYHLHLGFALNFV